jgi:hypothetical protein
MLDSVLIWAVIASVLGILSSLAGITEVAKQAFSKDDDR